jgi:hypothetical protein
VVSNVSWGMAIRSILFSTWKSTVRLDIWSDVLRRVYSHLRADTILGKYTPVMVEQTVRRTTNDLIFDFLTHLRQNGEVDVIEQNSIAINNERARREIKLLDHPRLKNLGTNSRPASRAS